MNVSLWGRVPLAAWMVIAPVSAMVAWGAEPLPGTAALELSGDLSMEVVDRVDRWFLSETARRQEGLAQTAPRTPEDIQRLRDRLQRILGLTKDLRIAEIGRAHV